MGTNSQISSIRRHRDKKKRQLQHRQTQLKHHWAMHQARQKAAQMGLKSVNKDLGDSPFDETVIETMDSIWSGRGTLAPANLSNLFLQQMEGCKYQDYKKGLMQYLWTTIDDDPGLEPIRKEIQSTLSQLWPDRDGRVVDLRLKLRTCNRLISLLTTQGYPYPSPMFTMLAMQEQYDIFGLLLLRLMLLSRPSYQCFADAMSALKLYYSELENPTSEWIVQFLDAFHLNIGDYLDRDFSQKNRFKPRNRE